MIKLQNDDLSGDTEGVNIDKYTITTTSITNLALGKTATASFEKDGNIAGYAVDGKGSTRWESDATDDEWIYVDLGSSYNVSRVVLCWEGAYGSEYEIYISDSTSDWGTADYYTNTGDGRLDDLSITDTGRYVKMLGLTRATTWSFSLYQIEVFE